MGCLRRITALFFATALCGTGLYAVPLTINGATFDAPTTCLLAEGALVCKEDGQQLELWVYRKPLGATATANDSLVRKMMYFSDLHDVAVKSVMQSTGNDKTTPFSAYGSYAATGAAMAGKGTVEVPAVRFASVLRGDEVWQFLEIVATRTPRIEALSTALQRSLVLPAVRTTTAATRTPSDVASGASTASAASAASVAAAEAANPNVIAFAGALLSFQYPRFLESAVIEDSATAFGMGFKRKGRDGGPNLTISLKAPDDTLKTAPVAASQRRQLSIAAMLEGSAWVDVNKLGAISGAGYALIGTPDAKKGFSGVESIETLFAAELGGRLLEVRLTAEQKYSAEVEEVWTLLVQSLKLAK